MAPEPDFPSTIWGEIRPGPGGSAEADARALAVLAERYGRGIVAYLRAASRSAGRPGDDARDLAQDFFVWMIETGFLKKADPERGRFRAFLKTALRHYAADAERRRGAERRGGGRVFVPLEALAGGADDDEGGGPRADPADGAALSPDAALDAAWRADLVRRAIALVEADLRAEGRDVVFALFREYFLDPGDDADYRALGARHGLSPAEVSNRLQHAKALYRARLKSLVLDTVRTAEDLEEELLFLFGRRGAS